MFMEIMNRVFLENRLLDYGICLSLFVIGGVAVIVLKAFFLRHLQKWAKTTTTTLDDFIVSIANKIVVPFLYLAVIYFSLNVLVLHPLLRRSINILSIAVLTIFTTRLIVEFINYGFKVYSLKIGRDVALDRSLKGIQSIIKILIWGAAVIFFLDNMGFKISTVIAGLGIGGVAVALAAQAILKDLFSYISIIFDRPFEIGDFIIIDDLLGTVEYIGIKTTRIRSLGGEQLVFSNADLTDSRLRNYKRMEKRRVVFKLGVTYNTPVKKLKEIPKAIENIIKNVERTTFDRAHFFSYGDFNLIYEVVYYVMDKDYNIYMDIQQEINFAIKEEFEKREIDFAFPTQTIHMHK